MYTYTCTFIRKNGKSASEYRRDLVCSRPFFFSSFVSFGNRERAEKRAKIDPRTTKQSIRSVSS